MHRNTSTFVGLAGLFLLILGFLVTGLIFPKLKNYLIKQETRLEKGTKTFAAWEKIPFPFKLKLHFFNVTNPEEIHVGLKPKLQEIGPYVYDEFRVREILSIDEENDTIEFVQKKFYSFNEKDSGYRKENDIVTILNIGLVSTVMKVFERAPTALPMINDAIPFLFPKASSVFQAYSVRDVLFSGMKMSCTSPEISMVCRVLKSQLPPTVRLAENNLDYLVSMFHHINSTNEGPFVIERGLKKTSKGKIVSFKSKPFLPEWDQSCSFISGTDLTVNPNFVDIIPEKLDFFVSDFCRSFSMNLQGKFTENEIEAMYYGTKQLFSRKEEKCFCLKNENSKRVCPPEGTMNAGPCVHSPIILSQPHFFNSESFLIEHCDGLQPDMNKHGSFIILEPKTGVVLSVRTRIQMSIFLKQFEEIELMENVTEGLFPFMWLEECADVPAQMQDEIRNNFKKLQLFDTVKYAIVSAGLILLGVSLGLAMFNDKIIFSNRREKSKVSPLPSTDFCEKYKNNSWQKMYEKDKIDGKWHFVE